jgi:hypothetical protein
MNYTLSKKFKGGTLSPDGNEIGIGTGAAAFDILEDTRELNGMRTRYSIIEQQPQPI